MPDSIDPRAPHIPSSSDLERPLTACPAWCEDRTPDHPFYDEAAAGGLIRTHSVDVGSVVGATLSPRGEHQGSASVDVIAAETVQLGETGVETVLEQPRIVVWAEYVLLSGGAARELAALLVTAADKLDEVLAADL